MTLSLHTMRSSRGSRRRSKRVGRGNASGRGTYSGRGLKGQRSRSGGKRKAVYQGKRIPAFVFQLPKKRGFRAVRTPAAEVQIATLDASFATGATVTIRTLRAQGLIPRGTRRVRIIGSGTLSKKLVIKDAHATAAARSAIEKAGGSIVATTPQDTARETKNNTSKT